MCGIAALISLDGRAVPEALMEKMTGAVAHRGPDGEGFFFGDTFAFGHKRLSIIDLSPKGRQPMAYKGNQIIHNGEVYNFRPLREKLQAAGYTFTTGTDTEVILAAYDYWGTECVRHFNGMWAFVIYDRSKNILFASRDRFGIKPLYYRLSDDYFALVSEIKQLTFLPDWKAVLNKKRAFDFLSVGYHHHTGESLFDGVFVLPAGHNLIYDLAAKNYVIRKYYDLEQIKPGARISFEEAKVEFRRLFEDSVRLRMIADVNIGSALSGGLDSSSIVCTMAAAGTPPGTVSAVFEGEKYDERPWIRPVLQRTKALPHFCFPDLDELPQELDRMTWIHDEPVIWPALFTQYCVFKEARRQKLTVMLDGQGGDEVLAGYPKFYKVYFQNLFRTSPLNAAVELVRYFRLHQTGIGEVVRRSVAYAKKGKKRPDWLDAHFAEAPFRRRSESTVREVSISLLSEVGLPALLHYEDRNSMAFSIESRLPFLDYRLVELLLKIPDDFKIRHAKRKYILREALKDLLPEKIYSRYDKMGFETPFGEWMQNNPGFIRKEMEDAVSRLKGIVTPEAKELKDPLVIWRIIAFNRWVKVFGVQWSY